MVRTCDVAMEGAGGRRVVLVQVQGAAPQASLPLLLGPVFLRRRYSVSLSRRCSDRPAIRPSGSRGTSAGTRRAALWQGQLGGQVEGRRGRENRHGVRRRWDLHLLVSHPDSVSSFFFFDTSFR
jgi:hypothetical protein